MEEKARVAKEKELETARLRAKQERAADRQAEIDELRARRCCIALLLFVLSYAVLSCAVLCCAALCYAMPC